MVGLITTVKLNTCSKPQFQVSESRRVSGIPGYFRNEPVQHISNTFLKDLYISEVQINVAFGNVTISACVYKTHYLKSVLMKSFVYIHVQV